MLMDSCLFLRNRFIKVQQNSSHRLPTRGQIDRRRAIRKFAGMFRIIHRQFQRLHVALRKPRLLILQKSEQNLRFRFCRKSRNTSPKSECQSLRVIHSIRRNDLPSQWLEASMKSGYSMWSEPATAYSNGNAEHTRRLHWVHQRLAASGTAPIESETCRVLDDNDRLPSIPAIPWDHNSRAEQTGIPVREDKRWNRQRSHSAVHWPPARYREPLRHRLEIGSPVSQ